MPSSLIYAALSYYCIISIITVIITVKDKSAAQSGKWRIPEARLFTYAFLGGALAELITMKLIRHKTKHLRFMIGLPVIIIIHIAIIVFIVLKVAN